MVDWKDKWPERVDSIGRMRTSLSVEEKQETWLYRSQQIHGDRYLYDNVVYTTNKGKVAITCKEHGDFYMLAANHLKGQGCPACGSISAGNKLRKDWSHMRDRFISTHGDRYDYSKVKYVDANTKVEIHCKEHGAFSQRPANHALGSNCPKCSKRPSDILYFLRIPGTDIYKIGVTSDISRRLRELKLSLGNELVVVKELRSDSCLEIEKLLLNKYTVVPDLGNTVRGYSEYRTLTELEVKEICEYLETL